MGGGEKKKKKQAYKQKLAKQGAGLPDQTKRIKVVKGRRGGILRNRRRESVHGPCSPPSRPVGWSERSILRLSSFSTPALVILLGKTPGALSGTGRARPNERNRREKRERENRQQVFQERETERARARERERERGGRFFFSLEICLHSVDHDVVLCERSSEDSREVVGRCL
jgi:hypothetical protein